VVFAKEIEDYWQHLGDSVVSYIHITNLLEHVVTTNKMDNQYVLGRYMIKCANKQYKTPFGKEWFLQRR